jgi:hypothetical protein
MEMDKQVIVNPPNGTYFYGFKNSWSNNSPQKSLLQCLLFLRLAPASDIICVIEFCFSSLWGTLAAVDDYGKKGELSCVVGNKT